MTNMGNMTMGHISLVVITVVSIRSRHQRCRHCLLGILDRACRLSATVRSTWTRRGGPSLFLHFLYQYCLFALHSWPERTDAESGFENCLLGQPFNIGY